MKERQPYTPAQGWTQYGTCSLTQPQPQDDIKDLDAPSAVTRFFSTAANTVSNLVSSASPAPDTIPTRKVY